MPRDKIVQKVMEIENPILMDSQMDQSQINSAADGVSFKSKASLVWVIAASFLVFLSFRLFFLQVVKGSYYQQVAENNRIRSIIVKAPRGIIKDKNGEVLARNIPSFDAVFVPAELPADPTQREAAFDLTSRTLQIGKDEIDSIVGSTDKKSKEGFLLKENIGYDNALILVEKYVQLPGIYIEQTARREYVDSTVFSPVIGYDGKITQEELIKNPDYLMTDYIGKNGIEYTYEKELRGKHGEHRVEVDSNGQIKEDLGMVNPVPGDELTLNIDAALQRKVAEVLEKTVQENPESTGATAVAINPQNGAVLALVNVPSYDNNLFAAGISSGEYSKLTNDPDKPLINRAISGEYPPGSTFKMLVAAAALEEKVINENTTVNCTGGISIGAWRFPDWTTHGVTDVRKAIAQSCDVFFYSVGGGRETVSGLGIDRIKKYATYFGLGDVLGIDLPWESKGLIPTEEWKFKKFGEKWYVGDDYHCAIGQGYITATPLQLADYIATVANGGKLYRPQVVDKVIHLADNGKEQDIQPELIWSNFVSAKNIQIVREGMRQTVTEGSGRLLNDLKVETAGKTGTAQYGGNEKTHSWYASFGPYDNPEIAMIVLIEGGGEGHTWAVPASKEIYKWYFDQQRGTILEEDQKDQSNQDKPNAEF